MLSVAGLTLSRGERVLFRDLSLSVASGEAVALTGANGAGKTSLLRAIAGFIRPDAGTIEFTAADAAEARAKHLHWLGHLDGLKGARRARDELAFQARWHGADATGLAAAIDVLALEPLLDLEVRKLSAGQRRRLAFARLVAAPRPLWLLDEPFAPLDARWRKALGVLMQAHLDKGGAILAAVHDPLPVANRAVDVGGGR
ncbi:heme ABC exporter ATP-binding protein CcmA [Brevundimonas sp. Root1279]|uniref:heme ABC exporter ATP-binding protein CcmA n=1 Tax=Brevundimonas sp. Root1279 TaxID=1736443 RepID=UPI0006F6872F|nr:heme ABC exporter ATP-binding protein CcmA [Brevundimonas sp. Root1279]KQW86545.1 cytochrome C biogenesis protein CcmA [Brevundimonas sp. Root1279]